MYTKIYQKYFFPFYEEVLKKRKTLVFLKELDSNQWLSEEEILENQWKRLQRVLIHAYENVPYYRRVFNEQGLHPDHIKTQNDFNRVPFLTKKDIRDNQDTLIAENFSKRRIFNTATGGSTGVPLKLKLDHENYEWRQAAVKRVYGWAGYEDGAKTVFIWGGSVGKVPLLKKLKHDLDEFIKRHKIYNTFYFDKQMMLRCIKEINSFKPKTIIAYTTPIYNFAKFIKENNAKIFFPRSIIVAAEKLFSYQRELIEEVFRCPVFETYGCREVTSIAAECDQHSGMHINAENIYLEVVKGNENAPIGELGEIVLTDLTNYCMPLIRYKNEDIASLSGLKCNCGRGLPLLQKVEGRSLDTIQTCDGKLIPGEFFPHLMKDFEEIDKFQVVQNEKSKLLIKIVKRVEFSKDKFELLRNEVLKVLGTNISVDFQFVEDIPLTTTGKFRVVVSTIPISFENY